MTDAIQIPTADPIAWGAVLWPKVYFYQEQQDIIYSVLQNDETVVVAGHQLGKDFVTAFIVLYFFLSRHPCRIVTTSADYNQLEVVLWGELRRFIQTSALPLDAAQGGPLLINHLHLRKVINGSTCGVSYVIGRVAAKGEGMAGHHVTPDTAALEGDRGAYLADGIPRTLFVGDEASGIDDLTYERTRTWANRTLIIGNPYTTNNFFYRAVKEGDLVANG